MPLTSVLVLAHSIVDVQCELFMFDVQIYRNHTGHWVTVRIFHGFARIKGSIRSVPLFTYPTNLIDRCTVNPPYPTPLNLILEQSEASFLRSIPFIMSFLIDLEFSAVQVLILARLFSELCMMKV
jgi:hypothetical protein